MLMEILLGAEVLSEWPKKIKTCEVRGHPFPQITISGLSPNLSNDILSKCSGCGLHYERPKTPAETIQANEIRLNALYGRERTLYHTQP